MKNIFKTPLITFGITTYKRPELLKETVKSVLSQDYRNFKIIIGNDNPLETVSFKTLNIKEDPRVEILNYKKNIGEISNMNHMLFKARSEWFSWLADDDVLHPQFISKFIDINNRIEDKNISAILCDYIEGHETSNYIKNARISNKSKSYSFNSFVDEFLRRKIKVISVYGFLKTRIVKEIGGVKRFGFGPALYGDTAFTIELAGKGKILFNQSQLFFLRTHQGSISTSIYNRGEISSSQKDFLKFIRPIFISNSYNKDFAEKLVFNTVKWFCYDNLGGVLKNDTKHKVISLIEYVNHQKKWFFEIKKTYAFLLSLFIFSQLALVVFNYLKLRFIRLNKNK